MEGFVQEFHTSFREQSLLLFNLLLSISSDCHLQAYKHIFTSPSSVSKVPKATRSGNARIHGMTSVTPGSIAYIATQVRIRSFTITSIMYAHLVIIMYTQVRFALSSSSVFSRTDTTTNSKRFYNSVLDYFENPDEQEQVKPLLLWWNQ